MLNSIYIALWAFQVALAASPVRVFLQENRLDEAIPVCRQFEVLPTNDKDNAFACAWVYFRTERVDSAEKLLKTLKSQSSTPEYQILEAFSKMKKKRYEEAKASLSNIAKDNKGSSIGLTAQELYGELYEAMGQLDTAAFIYKQLVDDDPQRARAHWGLGRYYLGRGDTHRAQNHLEQTARLWPKHIGSRYSLGTLALANGVQNEAAKWLAECYKLDKADPGVLEQLGILFEKKGAIDKALKYWTRALEIKKDSPVAREKLALYTTHIIDALIETKQYEKALAQLEAMGAVVNDQPKLLLKRGIVYSKVGKWDKAVEDLRNYVGSNPNDGSGLRELGICYVNLRLTDKAGSFFARAVSVEPENGMNHAWIAYVLEAKGEFGRAYEEWKRASELLKDPAELDKANRRVASLQKKLSKMEREKETKEKNKPQEDGE